MSNIGSHVLLGKSLGALQRKLKGYLLFDDKYLKDSHGIYFFQQGEIVDAETVHAFAPLFGSEFFASVKTYKKSRTENVDHNKVDTLEKEIQNQK